MENKIPKEEGELIKQGPDIEVVKAIESVDDLFESEIIREFVKNSGQYLILPKGTLLMEGICNQLVKYIKIPFGFEEVVLPKIIPMDTIRKADILGKSEEEFADYIGQYKGLESANIIYKKSFFSGKIPSFSSRVELTLDNN